MPLDSHSLARIDALRIQIQFIESVLEDGWTKANGERQYQIRRLSNVMEDTKSSFAAFDAAALKKAVLEWSVEEDQKEEL